MRKHQICAFVEKNVEQKC